VVYHYVKFTCVLTEFLARYISKKETLLQTNFLVVPPQNLTEVKNIESEIKKQLGDLTFSLSGGGLVRVHRVECTPEGMLQPSTISLLRR
jgi:hypothetical protein